MALKRIAPPDCDEWRDESYSGEPNLSVHNAVCASASWTSNGAQRLRLVGNKIQALGCWRQEPINRNFVPADDSVQAENGFANDNESDSGHNDDSLDSKLRRVEFTLLGFA